MIMHWPQIAVIILFAISFGANLQKHGEETKVSIWMTSFRIVIFSTILYYGRFFG